MGCCCDPLTGGGGASLSVFSGPLDNGTAEFGTPVVNDGFSYVATGVTLPAGTYLITYNFERVMGDVNPNLRFARAKADGVDIPGGVSLSYDFTAPVGQNGRYSFSRTFPLVTTGCLFNIEAAPGDFFEDGWINIVKVA